MSAGRRTLRVNSMLSEMSNEHTTVRPLTCPGNVLKVVQSVRCQHGSVAATGPICHQSRRYSGRTNTSASSQHQNSCGVGERLTLSVAAEAPEKLASM